MSGNKISVLLVGIGGYGNKYVEELLYHQDRSTFEIAGVVDINPERCSYVQELKDRSIPFYTDMASFYESSRADLAIISTPIQYHSEQVCLALSQGSHVLCEKPIAATVQDAQKMMEMQKKTGKFVAVGYNLSFNAQIQELKRHIAAGLFGRPKRMKTLVLWRRGLDYFGSGWKGRKKGANGEWILDSVVHNATSHFLHNMFYLIGPRPNESAKPVEVTAELYRANDIETFDTCALKVNTDQGVDIFFYASHTILGNAGPVFTLEFEKAVITFYEGKDDNKITAVFHDGTEKVYPSTNTSALADKLRTCIAAAATGADEIPCGLEAAYPQLLCVNAVMDAIPEVPGFEPHLVHHDEDTDAIWVESLEETLWLCYDKWQLPAQAGAKWAAEAKAVDLAGYRVFKG
ncbi:Gfo/Idh/MocA family protein [Paenibacillus xerothermodurans]|nr:Gfo/Idh/MocA family oxidoreductase [Paenibacillus xerothermodurans]